MIDHVKLFATDPAASRAFYERALKPLGYRVMLEPAPGVVGMGVTRPDFWIAPAEGRADALPSRVPGRHPAGGRGLPRRRPRRRRHGQRRARPAPALPPELLRRLRARPRRQQRRGRLPRRDAAGDDRLGLLLLRGGLDRHHAQAVAARALEPRGALHDAVDVAALEDLVLEQGARQLVELVAVLDDQLRRPRIASSVRCCCSSSRSSRVRSETRPPSWETRREVIVVPIA